MSGHGGTFFRGSVLLPHGAADTDVPAHPMTDDAPRTLPFQSGLAERNTQHTNDGNRLYGLFNRTQGGFSDSLLGRRPLVSCSKASFYAFEDWTGRSAIGRWMSAAATPRAIASHQTGSYDPVAS